MDGRRMSVLQKSKKGVLKKTTDTESIRSWNQEKKEHIIPMQNETTKCPMTKWVPKIGSFYQNLEK